MQDFSAKCNFETKYKIDWGDGQQEEIGPFDEAKEIHISHTWYDNNKYIIKMKSEDCEGESSGSESTVQIDIYSKIPLDSPLQDVINTIENYTEICLTNIEYNAGEIFIKDKSHISIISDKNYAILAGNDAESKITINESDQYTLRDYISKILIMVL